MRSPLVKKGIVYVMIAAGALAALGGGPHARAEDKKTVQVTVLAILATERNSEVDPRLKCFAEKVQKVRPALTGFRLKRTTSKSVEIGSEVKFPLVDKQVVAVTIEHGCDKKNRIGLTVKPPQLGEVSYKCCCGKFLPIWTDYKTSDKDVLLIGIMVEPCNDCSDGCDEALLWWAEALTSVF